MEEDSHIKDRIHIWVPHVYEVTSKWPGRCEVEQLLFHDRRIEKLEGDDLDNDSKDQLHVCRDLKREKWYQHDYLEHID